MKLIEDGPRPAPDRFHSRGKPRIERRDVDQPHIVELVPWHLLQSLVDRSVEPVMAMVWADHLGRIISERARLAISERQQIDPARHPLIVGETLSPSDHHSAQMAVARKRPPLGAFQTIK